MTTRRNALVKKFFVEEKNDEGKTYFMLNDQLKVPKFKSDQEACQFLVDVVREWTGKTGLACGGSPHREEPESEWGFSYKTPSTCGGCIRAQEILDKIFGDRSKFNSLCFVQYHGDRQYSFSFEMLKHFAENGKENTVRLMQERKQEAARKDAEAKAEEQRKLCEKQDAKLNERLGKTKISDELRQQILPFVDRETLKIVNSEIGAVVDSRSEYGSSGGIGYWDQIRVFCGAQSQMQEWQWRDRYSARNDKPWNRINGIGKVKVSEKDNKTVVEVELLNEKHSNRTAWLTFDKPKAAAKKLSAKQQTEFVAKAESEMARVLEGLEKLWECKPQMLADYPAGMTMPMGTPSYVAYRRPSIKEKSVRSDLGVAVFITQEQIDHRGSDPQFRYELHLLKHGQETAHVLFEDHSYEKREGSAVIALVNLNPAEIEINTRHGKQVVKL